MVNTCGDVMVEITTAGERKGSLVLFSIGLDMRRGPQPPPSSPRDVYGGGMLTQYLRWLSAPDTKAALTEVGCVDQASLVLAAWLPGEPEQRLSWSKAAAGLSHQRLHTPCPPQQPALQGQGSRPVHQELPQWPLRLRHCPLHQGGRHRGGCAAAQEDQGPGGGAQDRRAGGRAAGAARSHSDAAAWRAGRGDQHRHPGT